MKASIFLKKIQELNSQYENLIFIENKNNELYFYNGDDPVTDDNESIYLNDLNNNDYDWRISENDKTLC